MELFLIWLITILISIGINCKYVLAFTKKFADQGIKFKSESSEEGFGQNRISISLLIPFLNLFLSVQNFLNLNNHFEDILYDHQYEVMSRFEKREYAKKKTGFHAFSVFRLYKQLIGQASIFCSEEPEKGEIYFLPIQDDIVILHATGVFIYFSDEELKKKCENVSFAFNREVLQLLEDIVGKDGLKQLQKVEDSTLTDYELKKAYEEIFNRLVEEKMNRINDDKAEEKVDFSLVRSRNKKRDR